ncbi:hypothetical protein QQP08_015394 [Theobroma cacao]|nr:hypothetical protein QQP08_015394 [Theobroma cacao]
MREVKTLSNEIAVSGAPMNNDELVIKVLSVLDPDYTELTIAIWARDSLIGLEELYDKLLAQEVFLKHEGTKQESMPHG